MPQHVQVPRKKRDNRTATIQGKDGRLYLKLGNISPFQLIKCLRIIHGYVTTEER